jgi:hypothetical protein
MDFLSYDFARERERKRESGKDKGNMVRMENFRSMMSVTGWVGEMLRCGFMSYERLGLLVTLHVRWHPPIIPEGHVCSSIMSLKLRSVAVGHSTQSTQAQQINRRTRTGMVAQHTGEQAVVGCSEKLITR